MKLFGEVLFSNGEDEDIPFSKLKRLLEMPYLKPRYRLSDLTQDEQVAYINFDVDLKSREIFDVDYDTERLIMDIGLATKKL